MINENKAYEIIEKLLWTIEDYINIASTAKSYGTDMIFNRLDIHLIDTIGHHPGINVTELAKHHKITKSAVSQAVKKLEKRELIIRSKAPDNLKEVLFNLTDTGRIAYKAHIVFHEKTEAPFIKEISDFTRKEAEGVMKLLDIMDRRSILVKKMESDHKNISGE